MAPKRAQVPSTTFSKTPSALDKLTGKTAVNETALPPHGNTAIPQSEEAVLPQNSEAVLEQNSNTVLPQSSDAAIKRNSKTAVEQNGEASSPQSGNTVLRQNSDDEKVNSEKFTVYTSPAQLDKLDELALAYRKHTGKRVNRNVLMRKLIDVCDLQLLLQSDAE